MPKDETVGEDRRSDRTVVIGEIKGGRGYRIRRQRWTVR